SLSAGGWLLILVPGVGWTLRPIASDAQQPDASKRIQPFSHGNGVLRAPGWPALGPASQSREQPPPPDRPPRAAGTDPRDDQQALERTRRRALRRQRHSAEEGHRARTTADRPSAGRQGRQGREGLTQARLLRLRTPRRPAARVGAEGQAGAQVQSERSR